MEYDGTSSLDRPINWQDVEPEPFPFDLESLLAANAEMERNLASGPAENLSSTFRTPLDREAVFSNFGLMLGIFPPATFFLAFLFGSVGRINPMAVILVVLANAGTALAGHRFGKVVARMVNYAEEQPLGVNLMLTVFIGALCDHWRCGRCGCVAGVPDSLQSRRTRRVGRPLALSADLGRRHDDHLCVHPPHAGVLASSPFPNSIL
jgi:hypothetical protein